MSKNLRRRTQDCYVCLRLKVTLVSRFIVIGGFDKSLIISNHV